MKVYPKIKRSQLSPDEIRVINVGEQAVAELLWEVLIEHAADYFYVKKASDEYIYSMDWNVQEGYLTYVVFPMHYALEGIKLDFERIRQETGITTHTLFHINRYKSLRITPDIISDSQKENGCHHTGRSPRSSNHPQKGE